MAKKKQPKKQTDAPPKDPRPEKAPDRGPYLPTAHPPAKNPTLLIVSVILFLASFAFLVAAAWSSTR